MKPPFSLVPDTLSHDTVSCLETLLEHARAGEVIVDTDEQPGKARPPAHSNHDRSPRAARPQSIPPGRRNAVDDTQFSTF